LIRIVVALLALAGAARAQLRLGTVEVEGARPAEEEAVPFVTVVPADQPSARVASVADLLERQAGVQVRSRGGLGSFTSVSLRGSDENEVAIFVDGVPLSRGVSGTIDLSLLPVDGLERVEIWRGVPPIELGAEAVGGAINLVTKKGGKASYRASAGVGSFGARSASAGLSTGGKLRADATLSYRGATGDFSYYDANGTLLDASDDHLAIRHNNGFDQLAADVSVGTRDWRVGAHGFWKQQGVPGKGSTGAESENAHLDSGRLVTDGQYDRSFRRADLHLRAFFSYERSYFKNPQGEQVGNFGAAQLESAAISSGLSGRVEIPWGAHQLWSAAAELRAEHRIPSDLLHSERSGRPSSRGLYGLAVADELRFWGDRLALSPGVRFDAVTSTFLTGNDGTPIADQHPDDWFFSPRLAARVRLTEWLTLRGSAGRFVRFPTLLEQFGDGAFILGRPQLRPETAWGGDLGAAFTVEKKHFQLAIETVFFGRQVSDYIAFVPAAYAATPVNLGSTRILGAEGRLATRAYFFQLTVDYTFLDAVDLADDSHQLPGRPRHQLGVRAEIRGGPFRLFYDLDYVSDVYRDSNNYNLVPGRALHGLGVTVARYGWSISVEVRNLADLRVVDLPLGGTLNQGKSTPYPLVDFFDYPLPGRALYATVNYQR
jgi:iron complex outermembrane receptor protein